jgi:hypothetical protein
MKSKCNNCKRESKETDGWWHVWELQRQYSLCPSCYRNKSLKAYRDTLLERIKEVQLSHSEPDIKMGMELMKLRCEAIVRDTVFNV